MPVLRRRDGRKAGQMRPVVLTPHFLRHADGSCLIELGGTRVLCSACFVEGVPSWLSGKGEGWVTAEYGMLPASTPRRKSRPVGKPDSRGMEIQRLIGRVLRAAVRRDKLGENTLYMDCDVLEADGGTRTAAVTGAYVALALALRRAERAERVQGGALCGAVGAISVGIVGGQPMLDLDYAEDSNADVDMNVAMTAGGKLVEVQAAAERKAFTAADLQRMLQLARKGIRQLCLLQGEAIERGSR